MYTGLAAKIMIEKDEHNNTIDKTIGYISNWSVEETRDTVEVTQLGKQSKQIAPTLYSWTASADGTADFSDKYGQDKLREAMINGTKLKVKFYLSETDYLVGRAFVTSLSTDISAEDKGNISISLTGSGRLDLETAGTTESEPKEPSSTETEEDDED